MLTAIFRAIVSVGFYYALSVGTKLTSRRALQCEEPALDKVANAEFRRLTQIVACLAPQTFVSSTALQVTLFHTTKDRGYMSILFRVEDAEAAVSETSKGEEVLRLLSVRCRDENNAWRGQHEFLTRQPSPAASMRNDSVVADAGKGMDLREYLAQKSHVNQIRASDLLRIAMGQPYEETERTFESSEADKIPGQLTPDEDVRHTRILVVTPDPKRPWTTVCVPEVVQEKLARGESTENMFEMPRNSANDVEIMIADLEALGYDSPDQCATLLKMKNEHKLQPIILNLLGSGFFLSTLPEPEEGDDANSITESQGSLLNSTSDLPQFTGMGRSSTFLGFYEDYIPDCRSICPSGIVRVLIDGIEIGVRISNMHNSISEWGSED